MTRRSADARTFQLAAGECRVLRAAAGSRWVAARGMLRLTEPPRWLAERVLSPVVALGEGQVHVVEAAGWISLQALADSTLHCETPASAVARWFRPGRAARVPAVSL
jgi:hypothetical protein